MALTASQLRFLRICLLILGAAVIVCNLPLTSRVATRESSQSAWDNLDAIRNDTLGVSLSRYILNHELAHV